MSDAPADVPIDDLLAGLGYRDPDAQRTARQALEDAGLTNARKRNISTAKREAVEATLVERLARTCGSPRCRSAVAGDRRPHVTVEREACQVCAGSDNAAAVARLVEAMRRLGCSHLLVVGGSPAAHAELRRLLGGSGVDLQTVDGSVAITQKRAQAWAGAADVIAIWGSTILGHKVSSHFMGPGYRERRVTVAQRGIAALADGVVAHLEGRKRRR